MPKAVLKNGMIELVEPIPLEWSDGQLVIVEPLIEDDEDAGLDEWFEELQRLVAQNDPADLARVERAIRGACLPDEGPGHGQ